MSNSEKPSEASASPSHSNGIYRIPALPNLFNGADPKQRLPSFKSARRTDESLSATRDQLQLPRAKETTRKFTPKLAPKPKPSGRADSAAKPKISPQLTKNEKIKGDQNQKKADRVEDVDRRGKRVRETIQTSGSVFDANTEFEKRVKPTVVSESSSRQSRPAAPASDRGKRLKERKDLEAESVKMGPHSHVSESVGGEDEVNPVVLPMRKSASAAAPNLGSYDFDVKPVVKTEPGSSNVSRVVTDEPAALPNGGKSSTDVKVVIPKLEPSLFGDKAVRPVDPADATQFWKTMIRRDAASVDFFTIQFPDFIPVSGKMMLMRNALYEEEQRQIELQKQKQDAGEGASSCFVEANLGAYKLNVNDIPEGRFGTMRLRRSGKLEFVFPSGIAFPVIQGCGIGFKQDLCIVESAEETVGRMISVGCVRERLICVPDFEELLSKSYGSLMETLSMKELKKEGT